MERITLNSTKMTIEEAFEYFIFAKNSQGLTEKTIHSYRDHLHCISKYLDTSIALSELKKEDTQQMIAKMRECDLATNTIATYVRIFKVFLSWAREEGFSNLTIPKYKTEETIIQNAAYSYDNALALMAFISEDRQTEAKQLADAFVYAVNNDRSGNKRVRNAYASGDISSDPGWESGARLPGWYDNEKGEWLEDRYQVGSNVGNTSYVALALLQYDNKYGGEGYLETAGALMDWVLENCSDGRDGFTGGFDGWEEGNPPAVYDFTYKSIEHNIDAYAAFTQLFAKTGEQRYDDAAKSALRFVESMYDKDQGLFMTGTKEDGVTPNKDVVALDAQVWSALAMGDAYSDYTDALNVVEKMKTDEGGYPFCLENKNGGWWAEGTAYTALMYRLRGNEDKYKEAMKALEGIQLDNGLFPAATVENLSTGMELFDGSPWEYSKDPHIAPAAWLVMAANGFDPYVFAGNS